MTAGSRGTKQAREKRAVTKCSDLSDLVPDGWCLWHIFSYWHEAVQEG